MRNVYIDDESRHLRKRYFPGDIVYWATLLIAISTALVIGLRGGGWFWLVGVAAMWFVGGFVWGAIRGAR